MTSAPPTPPTQPSNDPLPQKPQFAPFPAAYPAPARSRKHIKYGIGGLALGIVIGAGIVGGIVGINSVAESSEQAARAGLIADTFAACELEATDGAALSPDQMSITISGAGEYYGPDIADLYCVGEGLGMPDSVSSRMGQTRALDGTQTADWDSFTVSWNYHPDDGLGAVFEYVPPAE